VSIFEIVPWVLLQAHRYEKSGSFLPPPPPPGWQKPSPPPSGIMPTSK